MKLKSEVVHWFTARQIHKLTGRIRLDLFIKNFMKVDVKIGKAQTLEWRFFQLLI
jgi:hypothetical protein